jgi:hypothetical protein
MPLLIVRFGLPMLALMLAGCPAMIPHAPATKPQITGILLQDNVPLSGVRIYSCTKGHIARRCQKFSDTITDSQGQFFFESVWGAEALGSYVDDPPFSYGIDFQHQGHDYHWHGGGVGTAPESVNLRCDIRNKALCTIEVTEP